MNDDKPCLAPFKDVSKHLAPEPLPSGIRLVHAAMTKLAQHYSDEFEERTKDLIKNSEKRYRHICITAADDIYSRIPEHKRS